jgi:small conductance mechanosensitive channel
VADLADIAKLAENPAVLEKNLSTALDTIMAVATTYGLKILGAVAILIIGVTLSGMVYNAVMRAGRRAKRIDITLFSFAASMAKYAVLVFTLVAMLSTFGVETTSFVAVLGAASLAIGLALQGTLSHVASGLMIILFRPFRIGDHIELGAVSGVVDDISLFTTELRSQDNIKIIVPNSVVWRDNIKNLTGHNTRRVRVEVSMPFATNTEEVIKEIESVIAADKRILRDPVPLVSVAKMSDVVVTLHVDVWVPQSEANVMHHELNRRVKQLLDRNRAALSKP